MRALVSNGRRQGEAALAPAPPALRAWSDARLVEAFLGRRGGVSAGPFATLNMSDAVGDEPAAVAENWRRARRLAPAGFRFVRADQVHGSAVYRVRRSAAAKRPRADALVTDEPGIALCVLTADCVPVLLADRERGVVGALHAGWRGVLAEIGRVGVARMVELGARPEGICAALGPAIGPCCFEVDAALAQSFAVTLGYAPAHIMPGAPAKAQLDLRGLMTDQLALAGVPRAAITVVGPCTRCAAGAYFSRRAAKGAPTGLELSFIGLAG